MVRITVLVCFAACGIESDKPPTDEPQATSHIESFELPTAGPTRLDLLFVIDDSAAMAPVRDHIAASLPAFADALTTTMGMSYHVGVITAHDGALRTAAGITGNFLVEQALVEGEHQHNFDGDFAGALTALGDVGATGTGATQPLAALADAFALGANPGFSRNAFTLVVLIANSDDASPGAIEDYARMLKSRWPDPIDIMIAGIYPRPAPRLDAFLAQFPNRSSYVAISDADLTPALDMRWARFTDLGEDCFDADLVQPFDCSMSESAPGYARVLPACTGANKPCWRIGQDPYNCVTTTQHFSLAIDRDLGPPNDNVLVGQCVVN